MIRCLFFGPRDGPRSTDRARVLVTLAGVGGFELVEEERPHRARGHLPTVIMRRLARYHRCSAILEAHLHVWRSRYEMTLTMAPVAPSREAPGRHTVVSESDTVDALVHAIEADAEPIAKLGACAAAMPPLTVGERLAVARFMEDDEAVERLRAERGDGDGRIVAGDTVDLRVGDGHVPAIALAHEEGGWRVLVASFDVVVLERELEPRLGTGKVAMPPGATLVVHDGSPRVVHCGRGPHAIGRHRQCDLPLDDNIASKSHAVLEVGRRKSTVRDDKSLSGTFVNGQRVGDERRLQRGDDIRLGQTTIHVLSPI